LNPNSITGAAPPAAGLYAIAAIPARYAIEHRDWSSAATLVPHTSGYSYTEATTDFARALGAAHLKDARTAQMSIDSLDVIAKRLTIQSEAYWAEQVAIEALESRAALDHAEGRRAVALTRMLEAIAREEATDKSATSVGPLAPARELYGDMLMDDARPADALSEYRKSLVREPNRYWSLRGAMTAAAAAGDRSAEADYASQLEAITHTKPSSAGR
jgi:hypothetical protein